MLTSPYGHIETFTVFLMLSRPGSILDIGLGSRKLGFVARDLLEVQLNRRYRREEWNVRIEGIEACGDYIQDHQRAVYDRIHVGAAENILDTLGTYDMIILDDVLEHLPKERALAFMDECVAHAAKNLAVFTALGKTWPEPVVCRNSQETRRSWWFFDEFRPFARRYALFDYHRGPYGAFLIDRGDYAAAKADSFLKAGAPAGNGSRPLRSRFDLSRGKQLRGAEQLSRIEYRIGNVLKDPRLLKAPLIMLDTDHDGGFERQFYDFLKENRYRGFLFLDDIHLNSAMIRFWDAIAEPKEDLTDLGHYSGSGLVAFTGSGPFPLAACSPQNSAP